MQHAFVDNSCSRAHDRRAVLKFRASYLMRRCINIVSNETESFAHNDIISMQLSSR